MTIGWTVVHLLQDLHQDRHQAGLDHLLDLGVFARRDVGQCPGRLLLDVGLFVAQQAMEHLQSAGTEHALGLLIRSCHDVPHGT